MIAAVENQPPRNVAGFDPIATAGDCWYDPEAAERAIRFFGIGLTHTKGKWAGQSFDLEPWQQDAIRTLFGWRRPDGNRRFRTSFWFLPRKNGKSTIAAGIANYCLLCDGEPEAECYCAASDREQASLVFKAAASMLRGNETLSSKVKIRDSQRRIIYGSSFLRAIPANEGGSHGFNSSLIVGDELHTWPNRDFYDTLHTSTGAREQPLEVYITTAGHDRESICHEIYQRAKAVRDGVIADETFLPVIYEAGEADDWQSPETWKKANPNLGVSVREDYIAAECKKAKESPAYENTFRRLHLNQWTQQEKRWIPIQHWDACPATPCDIPEGEPIYVGLDLSSTTDFTACVTVTPTEGGYKASGRYWLPEERIGWLERKHNVPVSQWALDGWVIPCPGRTIEYGPIHRHIIDLSESFDLRSIGYDPYNAHATRVELEDEHGLPMVQMRQGMATLSSPCKALERLILEHKLDHSGDPVLRWMADNVAVKVDENGNIKPVKTVAGSYRHIDGIVALVMAIGRADADARGAGAYESPGGLFL